MKKMKILLFFAHFICIASLAQKPIVDTNVIGKWPAVRDGKISNNGAFVLYRIDGQPLGSSTLVIQATKGSWKKKLTGLSEASFSDDSKRVIYMQGSDSITLLTCGSEAVTYIPNVSSFQLVMQGPMQWLVYQLNRPEKKMIFSSLDLTKQHTFSGVENYLLSKEANVLLFTNSEGVFWTDLSSGGRWEPKLIWKENNASGFVLDDAAKQLAFITTDTVQQTKSIWQYASVTGKCVKLAHTQPGGVIGELKLSSLSNFSKNGGQLFFTVQEKDDPAPNPDGVQVDVWSYQDARLQPQQLSKSDGIMPSFGPKLYMGMVDIASRRITRLEKPYEKLNILNDTLGLITYRVGHDLEEHWNQLARAKYYLQSLTTGERKPVNLSFHLKSPAGKYLVATDNLGNWFSYELPTGIISDFTRSIPVPVGDAGYDNPQTIGHRGLAEAGWMSDECMWIVDKYDIWQVDVRAEKAALNITNGYGRKNKITFRFIENQNTAYKPGDVLILDAFDHTNKNNGFYSIVVGSKKDPVRLTMGSYVFSGGDNTINGERPVKARDAENYLVKRGSATESPNYFWTKDFQNFKPISQTFPEREYNWLTTELIHFKTLGSSTEQGILYKPENFDATKKYPVIIHYYERKSEKLNEYLTPDYSYGNINIPSFVSKRYLVFTPDIHYTIGEIGQSAYNTIVGAGKFLSELPFVDAKRMGLSGHSFGGFETNYVITHSNLFAAALADAGPTNFVSQYGNYELRAGLSLQGVIEKQQIRMGATLWQRPDAYIENSPIFQADKVTTPVLLVNNKLDGVVHFDQGVQFFSALRRLGKKAWMLQYDGEGHSLGETKNQQDLDIRVTQFFDHYLKGAPAPRWMLEGIPAKLKTIDTGYELDTTSRTPGPGLLAVPSK
jgi:hypothetical protein